MTGIIQCASEAEIKSHQMDITKEKEMLSILNATYPGYSWSVSVHKLHGDIKCLNLSGKMGVRTDLLSSYSATQLKKQVILSLIHI